MRSTKSRDRRTGRLAALLGLAAVLTSGCYQQMADQPRFDPLEGSTLFADGRSARPPIPGTVARGHLETDTDLFTGLSDGKPIDRVPFELSAADLERGRQRYNIFCAPCHDQLGNGNGMVVRRGFPAPPSMHTERLRSEMPVGYLFDVMTRGFGKMASYAGQVPARDRWRIAAYIKALQLSQHARVEDVPPDARGALEKPEP